MGMKAILSALVMMAASSAASAQALNPDVTAETIGETVCVRGYTRTVRPGSAWLRRLKISLLAAMGEPAEAAHRYQLDHMMPLVLGGAAREVENYRLQPWGEAQYKDRLERKLGCLVCSGKVPLAEARRMMADDWRAAYHATALIKCRRERRVGP